MNMSATHVSGNSNLHKAKRVKDDEFYTTLEDIERELKHYSKHFHGKTVLLNCDDPYESNFFKYFAMSFNHLGLKKLIAVSYAGSPIVGNQLPLWDMAGLEDAPEPKEPYKVEITSVPDINQDGATDLLDVEELLKIDSNTSTKLEGDGDFRSSESVELLRESDIVVTNPPFSLLRDFVNLMTRYDKKYLIVATQNAITYKEIWQQVRANKLWLGVHSGDMSFRVPADAEPRKTRFWVDEDGQKWRSLGNACWFTNLDHPARHEELPLFRRYKDDPSKYPNYDNFVGIEVSRVADIPVDYEGLMGVPLTFVAKYNPDQFEIVAYSRKSHVPAEMMLHVGLDHSQPYVNGKAKYDRIFIKRR